MKTKTIYTTSEINRFFKIKVFGFVNGVKINTLVGVSGLLRILGDEEKLQKFVARAFASGKNRTDCKVYGGARISFYTF